MLEVVIVIIKRCRSSRGEDENESANVRLNENHIIFIYRKKQLLISFTTILMMILTLAPAYKLVPQMQCGSRMGYRGSTCEYCFDSYCSNCATDFLTCNSCQRGYVLKGGHCEPCSSYGCISCNVAERCIECAEGFRLEYGLCTKCEMDRNCARCDSKQCLDCKAGFTLTT